MTATKPGQPASRDVRAILPRQDRHRPKGSAVRRSKSTRWRALVLIAVHVAIGLHIWHWLRTGRSMSPVEPSEAMQTVEMGRINAGFVLFLCLIASTLIFGRWFCGWACHVVALQDLSAWGLGKLGMKPRPVRSRLLVLTPWVVGGYMFVWPIAKHWLWPEEKPLPAVADWQWQLTTDGFWDSFPGPIMTIATFVVVGFLIVWWLGAKGFCTYGCPYGAFFTVADRFAPVRIKVTDACEACGHCTSVCSSNVRVHEEVAKYGQIVDPGCMKCLDCVSVCPKDALYVGVAKPKPFATSQQRIQARADFTWWEEVLLAVIALVAVQWTFRGAWFGEGVPLLMAVGLGVITAALGLLALRLWLRAEVTFQHTMLKAHGRLTAVGRWVALLVVGWLLLSAHTFTVQRLREGALADAREPLQRSMYAGRNFDRQQAQQALDRVELALSWMLVEDPIMRELRAMLRGSVGRHTDAEAELTALRASRGELFYPEAKLALANYWLRGDAEQQRAAGQLLREVLVDNPNNPVAPVLLRRVPPGPR